MEFELNAQYYLDVVLRQWKVVLVVFIVATLAALAVSFIQEPTYEATVSMTELTYDYFDVPRLSPLDRTVVKLYPTLARTEAVESRVIEAIGPSLSAAEKTPGTLMSMVTIREDKDNPALFRIRVQASDPGKATLIANTWAEQYIEEVDTFQLTLSSELETVEQDLTMTSVTFRCMSKALGVSARFRFVAPFYPKDEGLSHAPFFYIFAEVERMSEKWKKEEPIEGEIFLRLPGFSEVPNRSGLEVQQEGRSLSMDYVVSVETWNPLGEGRTLRRASMPSECPKVNR